MNDARFGIDLGVKLLILPDAWWCSRCWWWWLDFCLAGDVDIMLTTHFTYSIEIITGVKKKLQWILPQIHKIKWNLNEQRDFFYYREKKNKTGSYLARSFTFYFVMYTQDVFVVFSFRTALSEFKFSFFINSLTQFPL